MENTNPTPSEEQGKEPQVEAEKEQTLEEIVGTPEVEEPKEDTVPLSAFLDIKKELKELQKTSRKADEEPSSYDIAQIAKEYEVDEQFVSKLSKAIKSEAASEVEAKYKPLLERQEAERKALEAERQSEKLETVFNQVYDKVTKENPDVANLANKEVIRQLAMSPANKNKTVSQLLEETYGATVKNKTSIESARPAHSKDKQTDFSKMSAEEANEASVDPDRKGDYADYLIKSGAI